MASGLSVMVNLHNDDELVNLRFYMQVEARIHGELLMACVETCSSFPRSRTLFVLVIPLPPRFGNDIPRRGDLGREDV